MTVPRTLRTASQAQSMVCLSRRFSSVKHLSDRPLALQRLASGGVAAVDSVITYWLLLEN
jgi:hypothetical protein